MTTRRSTTASTSLCARALGIAAAAALAALAFGALVSTVGAQVAGATYDGTIAETETGCGGGVIAITLSGDGTLIDSVYVDGSVFGGIPINDLTLPSLDINIESSGSFVSVSELLTFAGSFDGSSVSGTIDVPAFGCSVTYSATTPAPAPVDEVPADDMPADDVPADDIPAAPDVAAPAAPSGGKAMPAAGSGPFADSTWLYVASALAFLGVATTGVAVIRRRA